MTKITITENAMAKLAAMTTTGSTPTMTTDDLIVERLQDIRICDIGLRRVAANRIKTLNNVNDILLGEVEYLEMMRDDLQKAFTRAADTRDRLREALQQFLVEYDEVDLADAEPSSLTAAVLAARAALKGEAHE